MEGDETDQSEYFSFQTQFAAVNPKQEKTNIVAAAWLSRSPCSTRMKKKKKDITDHT